MRHLFFIGLAGILLFFSSCSEQKEEVTGPIVALDFEHDYTPTYAEVIAMYEQLDAYSDKVRLLEMGTTDAGKPLHLLVITNDGDFSPRSNREKGKAIVLVNNGIHPGEPCGIDASLKFADELIRNVDNKQKWLEKATVCILPAYNIGGLLNRSQYNRANQVGPVETGFRGNARNLDLNRDFLKCDSQNAKSFNRLFTIWNPDVFLDTHTTNGSDHQYAITLIPTNPVTLPQPMATFLRNTMLPSLYSQMKQTPYEMTPYVSWSNKNGGNGIQMTLESPRYSTGYSRVHYSYGFMTENHVYKPYNDRVLSVYHFLNELVSFASANAATLIQTRADAIHEAIENYEYVLDFELDTTRFDRFNFKGYESGEFISPVTGLKRFGYDRSKPYEKEVKYFTYYKATEKIQKPQAYVLPSAWTEVVERLQWNGVEMKPITKDTLMEVEAYFFTKVSHADRPYNGHYFHNEVELESKTMQVQLYAGDFLVTTNQEKVAYIMETLEPRGKDSFFRWNFFDSMLDRREYFSSWGFEENAAKYLKEHPEFRAQWKKACEEHPELENDHYQQMAYIYYESEWAEDSYMRYPVFRLKK